MIFPTIHVLPNPSGITSERYRTDAFGVAACKFIRNMSAIGYPVIHYGHEASEVDCKHVTIIDGRDFPAPQDHGSMLYHRGDLNRIFCERVRPHLEQQVRASDIVVSFYGMAHQDSVRDLDRDQVRVIEPAIGYPVDTVFASYRGFVSQAWMHYYYGHHRMLMEPNWYDAVIPNAFDPEEFSFCEDKDSYFVYLGRMVKSKGIDLAIQVTEYLNVPLIVASPGPLSDIGYHSVPPHVREVGYVDPQRRRDLLSRACCLMAPTYYIEPFGNIVAEAAFSGTPVLTSDWGGFTENVQQAITGYRCRDFQDFVRGARLIQQGCISPKACRDWAVQNFSEVKVHQQMHDWFQRIIRHDFYHVDISDQ